MKLQSASPWTLRVAVRHNRTKAVLVFRGSNKRTHHAAIVIRSSSLWPDHGKTFRADNTYWLPVHAMSFLEPKRSRNSAKRSCTAGESRSSG